MADHITVRQHRRALPPGAQGINTEHLQAGSRPTAKDDSGKSGVRLLARSKRGTRFRTSSLLGGTKQRRRRFSRLRWEETREGEAVGGARLTIETGSLFTIGIRLSELFGKTHAVAAKSSAVIEARTAAETERLTRWAIIRSAAIIPNNHAKRVSLDDRL